MTLFQALRILAETHTHDDPQAGFLIDHRTQADWPHTMANYVEAWKVVRQQLGLRIEPRQ